MIYAIKSIDGKEVNITYDNWNDCKNLVIGHKCVYKSFTDEETDALNDFLAATITVDNFGKGYDVIDTSITAFNGKYLLTRFENNNYFINVYQTKKGKRVTCKGYNLPNNKNLLYSFSGKYVENKKYGMDFIVESFDTVIEDSKDGIVAYLSSGLFKGVGEKKALAIYKEFGPHTMHVIENEPERIKYVKGFSKKSALELGEAYKNSLESKEITQFLLKYGISQKYAIDYYKQKGKTALSYIKQNPYQLCRLYKAIDFETVDAIAKDIGLKPNNPDRIDYCIIHVLNSNKKSGDIGMEYQSFCKKTIQMLKEVTKDELYAEIVKLSKAQTIVIKKLEHKGKLQAFIFHKEIYDKEVSIAKDIIRIKNGKPKLTIKNVSKIVKDLEDEKGIELDSLQEKAIVTALETSAFSVITGGPGMGKTFIEKFIIDVYKDASGQAILMSPTGCATRRMEESTGSSASTIHSYLEIREGDDLSYISDEDEIEIENKLVVVDELSMLDTPTAYRLFSAIKDGCRVVLIGDVNQLPSVGPGAILRDIINSGVVDVTVLEKIYRQKPDAKISENANIINSGEGEITEGSDFHIHEYKNMEDVKNEIADLYVKRTRKYGFGNVMCLCPYKEHTAGVHDMNKTLQDLVNPKDNSKHELKVKTNILREGDLVMHINCNTDEASNGDVGIIEEIDSDSKIINVKINNKLVAYEGEKLTNLTLAYARTVHKSQGQQAPSVIFTLTNFHRGMLYKNIPYVAISRASEEADFVGDLDALYTAMKNEVKNERITVMGKFLTYYGGGFVRVA